MTAGAAEPGGFRVRNDPPSSFYRVALEVNYLDGASGDAIRRSIAECYGEALAELDRRFGGNQDNRRQRAGGERRYESG